MAILINEMSKVVVQGITGKEGTFHTQKMLAYGTDIVAGVTPNKGGSVHLNIPVFDTVQEAVIHKKANVSIIFVPPAFAADAIMEAAEAGIALIVCISEGIPIQDMLKAKLLVKKKGGVLIGPNCPGIISPGLSKVGIMPAFIHSKGHIGIISRSGTLTYEAVDQTTKEGLGQTTCIGIGGDPIIGLSMLDAVKLFMKDDETKGIVLIGEIGGQMETEAAKWIKMHGTKPVVAFIAGQTAPKGRTMGHAGAIIGGVDDTAQAKMKVLSENHVKVVQLLSDIGKTMKEILR